MVLQATGQLRTNQSVGVLSSRRTVSVDRDAFISGRLRVGPSQAIRMSSAPLLSDCGPTTAYTAQPVKDPCAADKEAQVVYRHVRRRLRRGIPVGVTADAGSARSRGVPGDPRNDGHQKENNREEEAT